MQKTEQRHVVGNSNPNLSVWQQPFSAVHRKGTKKTCAQKAFVPNMKKKSLISYDYM